MPPLELGAVAPVQHREGRPGRPRPRAAGIGEVRDPRSPRDSDIPSWPPPSLRGALDVCGHPSRRPARSPAPGVADHPAPARLAGGGGRRRLGHDGDAFLASATPAAGKTTFGLHVAHRMLAEGRVARVAVVAPTTHICRQWAADAARYGIDLEPNRPNAAGPEPRDRHGVAVTYQTLAAGPGVHRRRCAELPTLLIADEPHHMGELAAWGRSTWRRSSARASGCCCPARRSAPTTRRSRGSPTTTTASRGRLRLRLHRRAARRRLPPGHLPHVRRRHGVDVRRPPPRGRLLRRAARRRGGAAACAPRSTPTATGSATCCATRTRELATCAPASTRTPAGS